MSSLPAETLETLLRVQQEEYEDLLDRLGANMPPCWVCLRGGVQFSTAIEYVRHLEGQVNRGAAFPTRHRPDCDGKCKPCRECSGCATGEKEN